MRRIHNRDERGVVMVWMALVAPVLLLMLAFAIDIGSWYLRADQIQRAADAASLAGVAKMPTETQAKISATEILAKNGFVHGVDNISVNLKPIGNDKLQVTLTDSAVGSTFAGVMSDNGFPLLTITKKSVGQHTRPLELGSPENRLGTGDKSLAMNTGGSASKQNFWIAIGGYCAAKEEGDPYSSKWKGTKYTDSAGVPHTACPDAGSPGPAEANDEGSAFYDPRGYNYIVQMPATPVTGQVLEVFDPGFYPPSPANGFKKTPDLDHRNINPYNGVGDPLARLTTTFTLWENGKSPFTEADDTLLCSRTFKNANVPGSINAWVNLCNNTLAWDYDGDGVPSQYRLNVKTKAKESRSWASNGFGLIVSNGGAARKVCDLNRTQACANIFGDGRLSTYVNLTGSAGTKVFMPMANLRPGYTGKPVEISLFDPGEGNRRVAIAGPKNPSGNSNKIVAPVHYDAGISALTGDSGSGWVNLDNPTDCGGFCPDAILPNRKAAKYRMNERDLRISFVVPSPADFTELNSFGDANTWYQLVYEKGSTAPTDRTTWSARVSGTDPVHLVPVD